MTNAARTTTYTPADATFAPASFAMSALASIMDTAVIAASIFLFCLVVVFLQLSLVYLIEVMMLGLLLLCCFVRRKRPKSYVK